MDAPVTTPARVPLTERQEQILRLAIAGQRLGWEAAKLDPVCCALERRGMVIAEPSLPGGPPRGPHRFIATPEGRMWVVAADQASGRPPLERVAPSSLWNGQPAPGSRWTAAQLDVLRRERVDDPERCATGTITQRAAVNEGDWTQPPPMKRIELPCLARTRDAARGKLVLPSGAVQWRDIVAWRAARRG